MELGIALRRGSTSQMQTISSLWIPSPPAAFVLLGRRSPSLARDSRDTLPVWLPVMCPRKVLRRRGWWWLWRGTASGIRGFRHRPGTSGLGCLLWFRRVMMGELLHETTRPERAPRQHPRFGSSRGGYTGRTYSLKGTTICDREWVLCMLSEGCYVDSGASS
ncbi:hypothetical protein F5148DRAFT_120655 [Russula earlei]|uniref:Uncharacterized protein n=1 Tax=Russula earlei TaxID=71964 RepID=A0ACC0U859_9AGAM|nr:hypothetical protein F5148DRAFT_120655 [Russula earlei]